MVSFLTMVNFDGMCSFGSCDSIMVFWSNWLVVVTMEVSARNNLKGTIKEIRYGQILAELVIDLGGGVVVTSLITKDSAENLGLSVGKEVVAIIKASNVMVGIEYALFFPLR